MSKITRREILPDPKYNRVDVAKLINRIMERGKKTIAQRIVYDCFDIVAKITKKDPVEVYEAALVNTVPMLEVKSKRVGGATYQVPVEVSKSRGLTLALRWITNIANKKKGKPMADKLAAEIISAFNKEGDAVKKREDTHRMAEANRAFAHFAK
jgi:small subunit ribosomal protein S7